MHILYFFPVENFHWLHTYFISFTWSIMVMLLIGYLYPKSNNEIAESDKREKPPVDMTPWVYAKSVSYFIVGTTFGIYLVLTMISS